jgi:dephospho-CoA kinase
MSGGSPFVLCLTGSLGMGKSTAAKFFADAGVPVHDSDAVVHALYAGEAVPLIERAFPGSTTGGRIDRTKLAAMVLHDDAALARLEALVHPLVSASLSCCSMCRFYSKPAVTAVAMRWWWSRRRQKSSANAPSSGRV